MLSDAQIDDLNLELKSAVFVVGPVYRERFAQVSALARGMMRPADDITLPDVHGAGAWPQLYGIYCALRRRQKAELAHVDPEKVAEASRTAARRTLWSNYCDARQLLEDRKRWDPQHRLHFEYAELEDGDLDVAKGGEYYPGWEIVASRVVGAMKVLDRPLDEGQIQDVVDKRRAAAGRAALVKRIEALEAALTMKQSKEIVEEICHE